MKSRVKRSLVLGFVIAFLVSFMLSTVTETALAANSYVINGKTVTCNSVGWKGTNGCWDYASEMFKLIWGVGFDGSSRGTSQDMLRNLSASELTLTAAHLRTYVSQAPLGSVMRISNGNKFSSDDNGYYHSVVIVSKDSGGFTVFENWSSGVFEHYYTWENFCRGTWTSASIANDAYIKYIKYPNAKAFTNTCATHTYGDSPKCTVCGTWLPNKNNNASVAKGTYNAIRDTTLRVHPYEKSDPDHGDPVVSIPEGAKVVVDGAVNNGYDNIWYHVKYGNHEGYIYPEGRLEKVSSDTSQYKFDVNGLLDGNVAGNLGSYGTFDVYINGVCEKTGVNDYCISWPAGTKFSLKNVKATSGHKYIPSVVASLLGAVTGTIDTDGVVVQLKFTTDSNWISIATGEYNIVNVSNGLYLDVANAEDNNGTNVQTVANNGNNAQKWTISGDPNGYRIDAGSSKTGKVLNMWGNDIVSGNNVTIYENTGHNSQRWVFEKLSNGNYVIRMQGNTNCVLDVNERNAYICTYSSGKTSQQWKLISTCATHSYTDGYCTKCGAMLAYKNYNASCEPGTYEAVTDTSLREKAYDKTPVLISVPKGAKVTVKSAVINGYDNRWYLATYEGVEGYIYETKITKLAGPTISSQPVNKTVVAGNSATFTIAATGTGLTYQWQAFNPSTGNWVNSGAAGAKTASLTITAQTGHNGFKFRCIVTDANGSKVTSNAATLTVTAAGPTINTQPTNKTVVVGNSVSFAITATGSGLTYQWQAYNPSTGNWVNSGSASAKTATLTITTQSGHNGFKFRCIVKDGSGNTVTSNAATLTLNPKFTAQPQAASVTVGSTATFTVVAAGAAPFTYQWQAYNPSTGSWVNSGSASAKTAKLSITAQTGHNGFKFRCIVTDANGTKITSNAATLTVTAAAPKITKQPVALTVKAGESASFSVTATGTGLTYQWQAYNPSNGSWVNSGAASAKTAKLTITAQNAHNGFKFRCVVKDSNGKSVTSSAVTLTVLRVVELKITKQPVALTVKAGESASFSVTATGTGLTYQWQAYNPSNGSWVNSGAASAKTAKLTITAQNAHNGFKFRCIVKDSNGKSVTSSAVTLTVLAQTTTLTITSQPASVSAANGTSCKFVVVAKGQGTLTYQWQYKAPGSSTWANSTAASAVTDTLRSTVKTSMSGYQFRCVVKDSAGNQVISNAATMTAK